MMQMLSKAFPAAHGVRPSLCPDNWIISFPSNPTRALGVCVDGSEHISGRLDALTPP